jgi:hypothetical protein
MTAFDFTPILCLLGAIILIAWGIHEVNRDGASDTLLLPEPRTPRPEPVEEIDWQDAWRDVGPTPSWEEVRRG